MVRERIDAYARYMRAEIANSDHIVEANKLIAREKEHDPIRLWIR